MPGLASEDLNISRCVHLKITGPIDTGVLHHNGGAACFMDLESQCLYVAGGNGLCVYSIAGEGGPENPKKVSDKIDTGAISHMGGICLKILETIRGKLMY